MLGPPITSIGRSRTAFRPRPLRLAAAAGWLLALAAAGAGAAAGETIRIGVVVDGPWEGNQAVRELTRDEVRALAEPEFEVLFSEQHDLVGDWTLEAAERNLERLLAEPEVDLVITWGILASHAACRRSSLPKPVIAPIVLDVEIQDVPYRDGASGVPNLAYVALPNTLAEELAYFRRMVPFSKVAILTNRAIPEAIPELGERTRRIIEGSGLAFEYIPVGDSAAEALAAISETTDAVFVYPLLHLSRGELGTLIEGLNRRRLPSFSALAFGEVRAGMLASLGADDFIPRLTRRVAIDVHRVLLGEPAASLPVDFSLRDELTINVATARRIGVSPSWDLLIEARLIGQEELEDLPELPLAEAVRRAVEANLDLEVRARAVAAGEQEVVRGRSALLPRLELSALGLAIDRDRAAASFGAQAERELAGSLGVSQLLFSDRALANLEIQRHLQTARELDLESLRLDITLEAATAYLDLLRAETLLEVQRNNLEVTRSNLELARVRRSVGAANPAEVFRWESQIATDRKSLIEAEAVRRVAEMAVNRLLHRDLGRRFATVPVRLDDPALITSREHFSEYIDTPVKYEAFSRFVAMEALGAAPELHRLDASIAAQERALAAARRAYWAPTLALRASLEEVLSEGGAGSGGSLGLARLFELPVADDTDWSVALSASLPLFTGGERAADRVEAELELERLRLLRASVAERVEQRTLSGLEVARASFAGIELAEQAAAAARQNLELVADSYARGAVSIIELLDAQAAALNGGRLAANSVYDFLIDLMVVQRAASRFGFFLTAEERDGWFERLDRFLAASPGGPRHGEAE